MINSDSPTLEQYQQYIRQLVVERGFDQETVSEVFTIFIEEVGELAKAIRKHNGQHIDKNRKQYEVEEEAADVFFLLLDLCNRLGIDLGKAFKDKDTKNSSREWSK